MGKKQKTTMTSSHFPNSFASPFLITSQEDDRYNCVTWSMNDTKRWWDWEEDAFWIEGIPQDGKLTTFEKLFNKLGFEICFNEEYEIDYQKIVLFSVDGTHCMHVARQLKNGNWTSKLGVSHDVEHTLVAMEGGIYGDGVVFMKRKHELDV